MESLGIPGRFSSFYKKQNAREAFSTRRGGIEDLFFGRER